MDSLRFPAPDKRNAQVARAVAEAKNASAPELNSGALAFTAVHIGSYNHYNAALLLTLHLFQLLDT